jgi:putative tryptophan/tyrosine transport system substrate-binding protein
MTIELSRRNFVAALGGAVAGSPLTTHAQQAAGIPTIGILWRAGSAEEEGAYFKAVIQGFRDVGYVDGRNIRFEHRFPSDAPDRFRTLAAELVSLKVDVIVAWGGNTAPYAKEVTKTIPIVFGLDPDPVRSNLVATLSAPGGNVTGFSSLSPDLAQKRLQFFKEVIPQMSRVAFIANLQEQISSLYLTELTEGARHLGLTLQIFDVRSLEELDQIFDALDKSEAQGITATGALMFQGRAMIAKLALTHRLPLFAWTRETFEVGALMSYGADYVAIARRIGTYVDKILRGARPADLPVQQPTTFQLLLNTKTAKALGINFPPNLLAVADEVIE